MNSQENFTENQPPKKRGVVNSVIVAVIGGLSAIYLLNPTAGFIELIPDNIPVFGNLDEAGAAALLISCLAYFGFDLGSLFRKAGKRKESKPDDGSNDEVIDV